MSINLEIPADAGIGELAASVARGDQAAEDQIVRKYAGRVMAMAVVRTRDHEASSELVSDVLTLTLVDGLEPEDIARRTGLSADAVRQRKSRAIKRLRQALSGVSRGGHPGPHI